MGVVYKAEDVNLGREAALKFLAREALGDAEHRERFLGEALLRSPWRCGLCAVAGQALGHRRSFSIRNLNVTAVGYVHFRSGFHAQRDSSSDILGIRNG